MSHRNRLDAALQAGGLADCDRRRLWSSVDRVLAHGPLSTSGHSGETGLALGYVQSGKTTAITALLAAAADSGYRIVIALLGSTNLLLDQNRKRLQEALTAGGSYDWFTISNPSTQAHSREIDDYCHSRGRTVLIPLLKHAGRISKAAEALTRLDLSASPVLIVDDEADQASLNTARSPGAESSTYAALKDLRRAAGHHLYVQFTATPYAPLLLDAEDMLRPDFVEFLEPGHGYTGGREFFVYEAHRVVRPISALDEQSPRGLPARLPVSLIDAFANFVAGTALMFGIGAAAPPASMLVHSTQRNAIQDRYHFLMRRQRAKWMDQVGEDGAAQIPDEIQRERGKLVEAGAQDLADEDFFAKVRYVLRETTLWLVNSASDVKQIDWNVAPVHVLVGGNKLDRGFTVEGLTVTYMNRAASTQIDTIEQRARAFGYRGDLLPYCQFFATPRTLRILRQIVDTEYDLRARLLDELDNGGSVSTWASSIGVLLPSGTRPSRPAVISSLIQFNRTPGWHQLRRPSLETADLSINQTLVERLGILEAPRASYGRLEHRSLTAPLERVVEELLAPWQGVPPAASPGWNQLDLLELLQRYPQQQLPILVTLMEHPDGGPRTRAWDPSTGFINLMQGPDPQGGTGAYAGDRAIGGVLTQSDRVVVQIHHVTGREPGSTPPLYTLSIHAGDLTINRKS